MVFKGLNRRESTESDCIMFKRKQHIRFFQQTDGCKYCLRVPIRRIHNNNNYYYLF